MQVKCSRNFGIADAGSRGGGAPPRNSDVVVAADHQRPQQPEPYPPLPPVTKYECPLCDDILPNLTVMRGHLEEHYPRDSPFCPVRECGRQFSHPNSVRNHMRTKHSAQWERMKQMKWSL